MDGLWVLRDVLSFGGNPVDRQDIPTGPREVDVLGSAWPAAAVLRCVARFAGKARLRRGVRAPAGLRNYN